MLVLMADTAPMLPQQVAWSKARCCCETGQSCFKVLGHYLMPKLAYIVLAVDMSDDHHVGVPDTSKGRC